MVKRYLTQLGIASLACFASAAVTAPALAATLVNTELVLSVDASGSVDGVEFNLQRQGYVEAFRDDELIEIIANLEHGIAVTLQYWATNPAPALPWHRITDARSANDFADAIAATTRPFSGGATNIAAAINSATTSLLNNEFDGVRQVIDVSGDGTQNTNLAGTSSCSGSFENNISPACTSLVATARDNAAAQEITINGLPILTDYDALDDYYLNYAVSGDEAFIQAAATFGDFGTAVKAKIKREILPDPDPETDPESVPEPSITLGFLVLGGLGITVRRLGDRPSS